MSSFIRKFKDHIGSGASCPLRKFDQTTLVCQLAAVAMNLLRIDWGKPLNGARCACPSCCQAQAHIKTGDARDDASSRSHDQGHAGPRFLGLGRMTAVFSV